MTVHSMAQTDCLYSPLQHTHTCTPESLHWQRSIYSLSLCGHQWRRPKSVASPGPDARNQPETQNYMKLFVAHKTTRNNTLNMAHVESCDCTITAAVANYKYLWRGNRTKSLSDFVQL